MRVGIDTNVLLRLIIDDGSVQAAKAADLLRKHQVVVAPSVFIEAEWVLRRMLGIHRDGIADGFARMLGLQEMRILNQEELARATDAMRAGFDFADALHAVLTANADVFATFDKNFARRAARVDYLPPVRLVEALLDGELQ